MKEELISTGERAPSSKKERPSKPRKHMQAAENRRRSNVPAAEPVPLVVDVRVTNPGDIAPAVGVAISEPFWMKLPKVAFF